MGLLIIGATETRPPLARCLGCGTRFFVGEETAYEKHVIRCSERHEEQMHAASLREQHPMIFGDGPEPDLERWVRVNGGLLREGRKKL
jgi:hypothetical protein